MNNKEVFSLDKEVNDIFIITMDDIDECLSEAIEKEDLEKSDYVFHIN
jgi:predicted ATP-dependent protease